MKTLTLQERFENGEFFDEYQQYIMDNCAGDRLICNGDMLIEAVEDGYLEEEFIASLMEAETA
jgi:hypothetical protein